MFNNSATDQERREKLEDLIKVKNEEQSDDENEIPDDQELNEMIARSEEELRTFNEMDNERYILEKKDEVLEEIMKKTLVPHPKHINYRLMQDFEVPEWVKIRKQDLEEDSNKEYGQGKRERKTVIYNDDMTESQWTKYVEDGKDP